MDTIDAARRRLLGTGALAIAGARFGLDKPFPAPLLARHAPMDSELAALRSATRWINSPGLSIDDLQGKVVLVDIGTYTCINWLRTLPWVRAWAQAYGPRGLVVVSVHCPEFGFEQDVDNVRRAMKDMRLTHPVAIDNAFAIWRAFENRYWPSRYLIDASGRIRHRQFGEGGYEASERAIQKALADAGAVGVGSELVPVKDEGIEAAADWARLKTPETYLGYERGLGDQPPTDVAPDVRRNYSPVRRLQLNEWTLCGNWTARRQAVVLNSAGGRIEIRFHARDLHLVMGPGPDGSPIRFRVLIDGFFPRAARGEDVDSAGYGTITAPRLYQLIRQGPAIFDRRFTIEFLDGGVEAYAFTFG